MLLKLSRILKSSVRIKIQSLIIFAFSFSSLFYVTQGCCCFLSFPKEKRKKEKLSKFRGKVSLRSLSVFISVGNLMGLRYFNFHWWVYKESKSCLGISTNICKMEKNGNFLEKKFPFLSSTERKCR